MDEVVMIADVAWIPRGVAKAKPEKVKLTEEEMKELIEGSVPDTSDQEDSEEEEEQEGEEKPLANTGVAPKKTGLRGSCKEEEGEEAMEEDESATTDEKYMKDFDKDDSKRNGMAGIAMYASNKDDPYITTHVESDDEEDKDENEIRPEDNLAVVAKIDKNEFTMEVYVYNEDDNDWYCHHHYILDAPPLCIEAIQHDPGNDETSKGNLMAVGTMETEIHIWDLDIVNAVAPAVTLGKVQKNKRSKRDGSSQGHSDAILSLAWNKHTEHVLASGGADKQIVLWDLDEAKPAQIMNERGGEVQSIAWHPVESTFLLAGTMGGNVQVIDCRDTSGDPSTEWNFESQIEKVIWNHFNPFNALIASEDGMLRHVDIRNNGQVLWEGKAHDDSIGGLTLSAITRGLLTTVGQDEIVNVWKVEEDGSITKVHSEKLHIGPLHSAAFNPDVATTCLLGGSRGDLLRTMNFAKIDAVVEAFS